MGKRSAKKILITAPPGTGKTTLIKSIIEELNRSDIDGFYTEEIREAGKRAGFRLKRLGSEESAIISHISIRSPYRVGRYGVDTGVLEHMIRMLEKSSSKIIFIDEIGKMECFSVAFQKWVRDLFESDKTVVATIAQHGTGLIEELKKDSRVILFHLTRENFNDIKEKIIKMIKKTISEDVGF